MKNAKDFYIYTVTYNDGEEKNFSDLSHALESLGFDETPDVNESDLPKGLTDATGRTVVVDKREPTDDEEERRLALALYLDVADIEDLCNYYKNAFEYDGAEYQVLTDEEADEALEEAVESYVDDCMDIPSNIRPYFDMEAFKRDVELSDGRGPSLACYDGNEESFGRFFIYRTN